MHTRSLVTYIDQFAHAILDKLNLSKRYASSLMANTTHRLYRPTIVQKAKEVVRKILQEEEQKQ